MPAVPGTANAAAFHAHQQKRGGCDVHLVWLGLVHNVHLAAVAQRVREAELLEVVLAIARLALGAPRVAVV